MANLSVSMPQDLLQNIQQAALSDNAVLDDFVASTLQEALERRDFEKKQAYFRARFKELSAKSTLVVGPITWTRDDLHE